MAEWGTGPFQNDDAPRRLGKIVDADDGLEFALEVLDSVADLPPDRQVSYDRAIYALMAAELVAAAQGIKSSSLPNRAAEFAARSPGLAAPRLREVATRACRAVMRSSGLREHWEVAGKVDHWTSDMKDLLNRLR